MNARPITITRSDYEGMGTYRHHLSDGGWIHTSMYYDHTIAATVCRPGEDVRSIVPRFGGLSHETVASTVLSTFLTVETRWSDDGLRCTGTAIRGRDIWSIMFCGEEGTILAVSPGMPSDVRNTLDTAVLRAMKTDRVVE